MRGEARQTRADQQRGVGRENNRRGLRMRGGLEKGRGLTLLVQTTQEDSAGDGSEGNVYMFTKKQIKRTLQNKSFDQSLGDVLPVTGCDVITQL